MYFFIFLVLEWDASSHLAEKSFFPGFLVNFYKVFQS